MVVTIVYATSPSSTRSSTPVTVTVCATFQLTVVKVSACRDRPFRGFARDQRDRHAAVGCDVSATVNVAVPPASVVVRPEVGVTVMPEVSLSVLVTPTSATSIPL